MTPQPKPARARQAPKRIAQQSKRPCAKAARAALKAWSISVRKRDGGRCQFCEPDWPTLGRVLDAHHIVGKKAHPEHRLDVDNGVSLCREHHQWAHAERPAFLRWLWDSLRDAPETNRRRAFVLKAQQNTRQT